MGRFYLRMPASKDSPEHWQLISENLSGPPTIGQLKLATYQGWARHVEQGTIGDELLKLRHRKGDGWHNVLYMTEAGVPGDKTFTYEFWAADVFRYPRFIDPVGWTANHENNLEWRAPQFDDSNGRPVGDQYNGNAAQGFYSDALSSMGWIGNENYTHRRYVAESVGWYSLPLGMFAIEAETQRTLVAINDPTSIQARAQLLKVDVIHRMQGYSVLKNQNPWMNQYVMGNTTIGLFSGTGSLRYQGPTPLTTQQVVVTDNAVYTVPTVRDLPFSREADGEILWVGNLNSLGMRDGSHGLPITDEFLVVQTFSPSSVAADEHSALQYFATVSPVPAPVPIEFGVSYVTANYMADQFRIVFTYAYD